METQNIACILTIFFAGLVTLQASRDSLGKIHRDFWKWRMRDSPQYMTAIGVNKHNDLLESMNISMFEERKTTVEAFLSRVRDLPKKSMTYRDRVDYAVFEDYLQTFIDGYRWRNFLALNPMTFLEGLHTNPEFLVDSTPFLSHGDFLNYLVRLKDMPKMVEEIIERMKKAIEMNHTHHRLTITRVPGQIDAFLKSEPTDLVFYKPFNDTLDQMTHISAETKSRWRALASSYCFDIKEAWTKLKTFLTENYMEHTRQEFGVGEWENGRDFYRACLRFHLSVDMTPDEVYKLGEKEVERILQQMKKVMKKLRLRGSVREVFEMLQTKQELQNSNAENMLQEYRSMVNNRIKPVLQNYFENLPDIPLKIEPLPFDGPQGMYYSASADGERPGVFYVNTNRPKSYPRFTFMALTLHEAEPGHHLQLSYAAQTKLPAYRRHLEINKYFQVPFNFPYYTAYVEGWGLYAEYLGEELGLYKDDYELLGRYSAEIFRACRLVVDTGIHYFNWSRDRAISYMMNYTALPQKIVENDIDRYITWPGQACSYKVGEIKIRQIRDRAKEILGNDFDIKKFHTVVLENGAMPLRVLESVIDNWVQDTKAAAQNVKSQSKCNVTNSAVKTTSIHSFVYLLFCALFYFHN